MLGAVDLVTSVQISASERSLFKFCDALDVVASALPYDGCDALHPRRFLRKNEWICWTTLSSQTNPVRGFSIFHEG